MTGTALSAELSAVNAMSVRDAALWYLNAGLRPIPWVAAQDGARTRKRVMVSGFHYATYEVSAEDIEGWDGTWQVGLALSQGADGRGVLCVDVDDLDQLRGWEEQWGLNPTWTQSTGREGGGRHYLYRWDEATCGEWPRQGGFSREWPRLEVKSNGFIAVSPSRHPLGNTYQWVEGGSEISVAGYMLRTYLNERSESRARTRQSQGNGNGTRNGTRNERGQGSEFNAGHGRPDIEQLLREGITEGGHDDTLRDVVWWGVMDGKGEEELWLLWSAIVHRTATDPQWPFEKSDFNRHYAGAREVLGKGSGIQLEPWMIGAAQVLVNGNGRGSGNGTGPVQEQTLERGPVEGAEPSQGSEVAPLRVKNVKLTWADEIQVKPVTWVWQDHLAAGTLALLTGDIGVGKSTLMYHVAAAVTRGELPGVLVGKPRKVFICATEDSWEHVIGPRLIAAGADRRLIARVEVEEPKVDLRVMRELGIDLDDSEEIMRQRELQLPTDLGALAERIQEHEVPLLLLDPLMSRLDPRLNTHKDAEVRQALEPLVKLADMTQCAMWAMIHTNKSGSSNTNDLVMGSRAFGAVARAIGYVVKDAENEDQRLFGTAKNNLGRTDLPSQRYHIEDALIATTADGDIRAGRLVWDGQDERRIADVVASVVARSRGGGAGERAARPEAAEWLEQWLTVQAISGMTWNPAAVVLEAGESAGYSERTVRRAFAQIEGVRAQGGFPRRTFWAMPGTDEASFVLGPVITSEE